MNIFSRSWQITRLTFSVINKDRELLWFALLSFVFSSLFAVAMIVPSILPSLLSGRESLATLEIYQYVIIFITYFGLAFIATFFNVCVVYTTKVRFEGGNATFGESIRFASSRLGLIVRWSLLAASVGLLLRVIEQLASSLGRAGQIVVGILVTLIGMAWSVVTIFVVPVLVYEGLGPIDAVKKSTEIIKRTWGESLVRTIGLGLMQLVVMGLLVVVGVGLTALLARQFAETGLIIGIVAGGLLLLLAGLVFKVAHTIFNTALYVYANRQVVAADFNEELIRGAFRERRK